MTSWENQKMDDLDAALRIVLASSGVPAADQSSVLHMLASDADAGAIVRVSFAKASLPEPGTLDNETVTRLKAANPIRLHLRDDAGDR